MACPVLASEDAERWQELCVVRNAYRKALSQVRTEHGGAYTLPAIDFFLFGMGNRTKWAKFGLRALGLNDPFRVPKVKDSYAALFWWEYKADDMPGQPLISNDKYPYLGWAACHYGGQKRGKLSDRDYPLAWEAMASQAKYDGIKRIGPECAHRRNCAPRTWHAAEALLYLIEEPETPDESTSGGDN
jgi:hypothetical protein